MLTFDENNQPIFPATLRVGTVFDAQEFSAGVLERMIYTSGPAIPCALEAGEGDVLLHTDSTLVLSTGVSIEVTEGETVLYWTVQDFVEQHSTYNTHRVVA
jgi:hypothetical protein